MKMLRAKRGRGGGGKIRDTFTGGYRGYSWFWVLGLFGGLLKN